MKLSAHLIWATTALIGLAIIANVTTADGDNNGPIVACVNPAGHIRTVASEDSCHPEETPLIWDIVGPEGEQGPQGPPGLSGYEIVEVVEDVGEDGIFLPSGQGFTPHTLTATCPEGKKVIGGGCVSANLFSTPRAPYSSRPVSDDTWECSWAPWHLPGGIVLWPVATAICADVSE